MDDLCAAAVVAARLIEARLCRIEGVAVPVYLCACLHAASDGSGRQFSRVVRIDDAPNADSARVTQAWSSAVAAVRIAWYALPDGA